MREKLLMTLSTELGVPREALNIDSTRAQFDAWDSLGHLNVILAVETAFGVRFRPEVIPDLTSVRKLLEELEQ